MSDPSSRKNLYRTEYEKAEQLFDDGDTDGSIALAQHSLKDPSLPPYFHIRYHIMIASAMDNWDDADYHRLVAEQAWSTTRRNATAKRDHNSLKALEDLRDELDQLEGFKHQDFAKYVGDGDMEEDDDMEEYDDMQEDDDMEMAMDGFEDEDSLGSEDAVAVSETGDQDEVDVKTLVLPIRSASEHEISGTDPPPPILNVAKSNGGSLAASAASTTKSIRR
jgi:molybdopterin-guanine dinucleotide biosynthesis protein